MRFRTNPGRRAVLEGERGLVDDADTVRLLDLVEVLSQLCLSCMQLQLPAVNPASVILDMCSYRQCPGDGRRVSGKENIF